MNEAAHDLDPILLCAGRVLFGDGFRVDGDWRAQLRTVFRRRALDTHPDRAAALGRPPEELAQEFQAVNEAYHVLAAARATVRRHAPPPRPRPESPAHGRPANPPPPRARPVNPPPPRPANGPPPRDRAANGPPPRARPAARPTTSSGPPSSAGQRAAPRPSSATAGSPAPAPASAGPPPLPHRPLRFAEYLFYMGRVPFAEVIEAVVWQRRQRPNLGDIAVAIGYLTQAQVREILERRRSEGRPGIRFGEFAVAAGYLTPYQQLVLVGRQRLQQRPIGEYFIERGMLRPVEIGEIRRSVFLHNARCHLREVRQARAASAARAA